jgi:phenylpyruvate tautomerase PptA (4-oxalocrotonate tautomerase family)
MLNKLIEKLKSLISKVFGKRKEEVVINERMKRKIAAGHTNVSK